MLVSSQSRPNNSRPTYDFTSIALLYTLLKLNWQLTLFIAVLMNQKIPGMSVFRTIYYMPAVVSGVAVAILERLKLPIAFVGVGEQLDDLIPFEAETFVDGLLDV